MVFEKECITRCSSDEWIARNGCALRWSHRGVGRLTEQTVEFRVKCAVLCVKDAWKRQFWGLRYCLLKLRSLLSFLSRMTSHSKIAQFNWECIGRLTLHACGQTDVSDGNILVLCSGSLKFESLPGEPTPCFRFVLDSFQSVLANPGIET